MPCNTMLRLASLALCFLCYRQMADAFGVYFAAPAFGSTKF